MKTFDLGFGNSVCVRKAFLETTTAGMVVFTHPKLQEFNYPPYEGDQDLIQSTKSIIKRQTGHDYKYILMTVGASGAISNILTYYKNQGIDKCLTRTAPYYLRYPSMISASGLTHSTVAHKYTQNAIALVDIPSNPLNLTHMIELFGSTTIPTIVDGVYYNKIYHNKPIQMPVHELLVGSYSKLTGINGVRVGWIATNNTKLYLELKDQVMSSYCGMSVAESYLLNELIYGLDWNTFETKARCYLDYNREELAKLERFTSDPVSDVGMFWFTKMDSKFQSMLTDAGVVWTKGDTMDVDSSFGRLNVGADCAIIKEAVSTILKKDRI